VARKPRARVPVSEYGWVLARVATGERVAVVAADYDLTPACTGDVLARLVERVEFVCSACGATRTARVLPRECAIALDRAEPR
jgi:hypothetical protein